MTSFFSDVPVIGALPPTEAAARLRDVGELESAAILESSRARVTRAATRGGEHERGWPFRDRPWQHTSHAFGFIAAGAPSAAPRFVDIRHVGDVAADAALRGARIRITLDGLRVASYPGNGTHRILFEFYARNQLESGTEELHFNHAYRVRDGESAGILGFPIFVGLRVGGDGVGLRCYTVNVTNDSDEKLLDVLESDAVRGGLRLATTAQPAIAPLSAIALGITKTVAARHRNIPVQDFYLGLDFGSNLVGARLAEGSYLAIQVADALAWDWTEWVFDRRRGNVVDRRDQERPIPHNYVVFGVSRQFD